MLYFYVDRVDNARSGVPAKKFSADRLYHRLTDAREDDRGKVLLVDAERVDVPIKKVEKVPKKALLNVNPYVPTKELVAGGGVVTRNGKNGLEILLIYRKGRWDLPKGKLDPGETIKQCAKREVREELGIDRVKVVEFLDTTVHGYKEKSDHFLVKTTHWYLMKTKAKTFVPQKSEKITKVQWFTLKKAKKKLAYESLVRLLTRVESRLR
ncbi:MAG: NUDIX domain-containing protein [Rhodothermales bacterium]|nr:NUDIX domain-containing protein [Rhodothermales bacterium]